MAHFDRTGGSKWAKLLNMPYFKRDDLLSNSELNFYKVLQQAISDKAIILAKVRIADIIFVKAKNQEFYKYHNKIVLKHIDFLICSPSNLNTICAIELDDSSHNKSDRIERDNFVDKVFETAKIPLIRFNNKLSYSIQEINEKILPILDNVNSQIKQTEFTTIDQIPVCSKCKVPMTIRTAKSGDNKGKNFYGCTNYPKCKEIVEINNSNS
ncbi:MAG: DUF2726 domain-containing protein [Clostridia bacterium]|nr:DUF2726 domain-containing protein [Clostridia bacterium]